MTVTASSALRTPATWPRHSSGTASANRALKPTARTVPGMLISNVSPISAQTCPWDASSQGSGTHSR